MKRLKWWHFCLGYLFWKGRPLKLDLYFTKDSAEADPRRDDALESLKKLVFVPNFALFNGHLQTIGVSIKNKTAKRSPRAIQFKREPFIMKDGGTVSLDWKLNDEQVCLILNLRTVEQRASKPNHSRCSRIYWRNV